MNGDQSHLRVACHMFSFDYGFTHVCYIWPDKEFNGELNGSYYKAIGATTVQVIDHCIKVCKGFACFLAKKLFSWLVLPSPFTDRVKP